MYREKISGIYQIRNIITNQLYIGKTNDLEVRSITHFKCLRQNKYIISSPFFQNSFNKYGENNFVFEIIEKCPIELLNEREVYWIAEKNTRDHIHGYNIAPGGNSFFKSCHHTLKSKALLRAKNIGKKGLWHQSQEFKDKMKVLHSGSGNPMYGKPGTFTNRRHTEESKNKCRLKALGRPSGNKGHHQIAWNKGLKTPQEICDKISASKKGIPLAEKTIEKIRIAVSGENNPMFGVHRYGEANPAFASHKYRKVSRMFNAGPA